MMSKATIKQRTQARRIARRSYLEAKGDPEKAKQLAEEHINAEMIGIEITVIIMLIQLAIKLISWWLENRVEDPGIYPQAGEPEE